MVRKSWCCGSWVQDVRFTPDDARRLTESVLHKARDWQLRPFIGASFPLERVVEAHTLIAERRTLGKSLILVGASSDADGAGEDAERSEQLGGGH